MNFIIVIPNFNGEKYIGKAIESALEQDYAGKRVVIVDGKSTDKSHSIIAEYAQKNLVAWIKTTDSGISSAINLGIDETQDDEIFVFLGNDDFLRQGALKRANDLFTEFPFSDAVQFNSYSYDANQSFKLHVAKRRFTKSNLRRFGTIAGMQNVMVRGAVIKKYRFDEDLKYAMDLDLYFRMIEGGNGIFVQDSFVSTLNMMDQSTTAHNVGKSARERYLVIMKYCGYFNYAAVKYGASLLSNIWRR
jgi:glycosyltransferase involved in cell wall biosynthesis